MTMMNMISSRPKLRRISAFLTKPIIVRCSSKTLADQPTKPAIPPILGIGSSTSTRDNDDVVLLRQFPRCWWWCSSQWSSSYQQEVRIGNNPRLLSTTTTAFSTITTTTTPGNDDDITPNNTINNNPISNNNSNEQQQLTTNENEEEGKDSNNNNPIDHQARWDRMLETLVQYKSIHGDTLVPATYPDNPQLGNWVDNKRQLYRLRLGAEEEEEENNKQQSQAQSQSSPYHRLLTDEKIAQLNSIEFVWSIYEYSWNNRYEEMKAYVAQHGNALVPSDYPANESLGQWVLSQRRNYKRGASGGYKKYKYKENTTTLSTERIEKLNEIGFVWDVHEAQWFERLEELKLYIADHGDTLVPKVYSELPFLGRWVDKQRLDYKRYLAKKKMEVEFGRDGDEGEEKKLRILNEEQKKEMERVKRLSTGMTEERIRLLEAEGFIWDAIEYLWDTKFKELCNFVAINGHAAIFRRSNRPYDPLARWAEVQRENYKKFTRGQKTKLTEERIERLNAINFVWGGYSGWNEPRMKDAREWKEGFEMVEKRSAK